MNSANVARRRLITIGLGWVSVAVLEAIAYTTLALSIADHRLPVLVLATATIALFVTVLVSRGGYFTGARLVGDLYDALATPSPVRNCPGSPTTTGHCSPPSPGAESRR